MIRILIAAVFLSTTPAALLAQSPTRITILVDAFADRPDVKRDWGYSALVEHAGKRILFDAGNDSELFRHNVEVLGIDLTNLDAVVISHRHGDHTDGLKHLLAVNPGVVIYVANDEYFGGPTPRRFFERSVPSLPTRMRYFDGAPPDPVPHGGPWNHANLHRVAGSREIAPSIRVVSNLSSGPSFTETPELSLVLDTPHGQVVLVGCSHPGIEAILASVEARTRPVRSLIGGLHWVTMPDDELRRVARRLADEWKVQSVAPGHCTGELGFAVLSEIFGRRYTYAGVGAQIILD
jgi:7,8-dihydropterin-6-yl-methyl-4-(beta-D-ribofuranosyl)aminobenzene 5'-phosphate synthase